MSDIRDGIEVGKAIANGMNLAKELGNLPGNICTPTYLAEQAQALAHTRPKVPFAKLKGAKLRQARAANRRVVIRIE